MVERREGGGDPHGVTTRESKGRSRGTAGPWLVLAVLLLSASPAWAGEQAPNGPAKIRLAVIPFTGSAAGVPAGLGEALGQAIRHGLTQVRAVRAVDAADMAGSSQRLRISLVDRVSDEAVIRLTKDLQVQGLVTGTYAVDGDSVKIQARLGDPTGGGQVILGDEVVGPLSQFLSAQGRITRQILQAFRVRVTPYDERRLQAAFGEQTGSLEAYALYAQAAWLQGLQTKEGHEQAIALRHQHLRRSLLSDQFGVALYFLSEVRRGVFHVDVQEDGG